MVHEQHARIRTAQPDTSGRRRADETDPVRHGADKGLRRDGGGLGIPHARYRARSVGPGYARKMEVSRARGGEAAEWAQEGGGTGRPARKRTTTSITAQASKRGGARPRWRVGG